MNFQVFGCPNCEQPFQVSADQAGQVVQCPSCAQQVEIPKETFEIAQTPPTPAVDSQQIFACPNCSGQFGITSEMLGQPVGCPHCQTNVLIQLPAPAPETLAPEIVTDRSTPKGPKKKKPARKSRPTKPDASPDLFAPGFEKSQTAKTDRDANQKTPPRTRTPDPPAPMETATDKEQRWRSSKKTPPKSAPNPESKLQPEPKPPRKPAKNLKQKPAELKRETAASKPRKQKPQARPANKDGPKTKSLALDATVELNEGPDDSIARRSAFAKPEVVSTEMVDATVTESPAPQKQPSKSPAKPTPATETVAPKSETGARLVSDAADRKRDAASPGADQAEIGASPVAPDPIDHLLPPRFDVLDPSQLSTNAGKTQFKVLLPDGKGGMAQLDRRIVSVEHEGERVSLVVMTPAQKKRQRMIQNIIAIIIGIAIMWVAFSILT